MCELCRRPNPLIRDFYKYVSCTPLTRQLPLFHPSSSTCSMNLVRVAIAHASTSPFPLCLAEAGQGGDSCCNRSRVNFPFSTLTTIKIPLGVAGLQSLTRQLPLFHFAIVSALGRLDIEVAIAHA